MAQQDLTPAKLAKLTAFKDISEECKRVGYGQNYILFEKDICEYLGIAAPDFRKFNGGHNKKK